MKKGRTFNSMMQIVLYVFFSSFGLVLLKMGTSRKFELSFSGGDFVLGMNYILIIGMLFYVASFITSLIAMKSMNLNVFYPVSAGLVYVLVCVLSKFILQETMSVRQMVGIAIILIGIIVMNIKTS